jgi:hypothetical protein
MLERLANAARRTFGLAAIAGKRDLWAIDELAPSTPHATVKTRALR